MVRVWCQRVTSGRERLARQLLQCMSTRFSHLHLSGGSLTKTMLLIGTPLVVICWKNFIHSWRSSLCHSWSHCVPHCFPPLSKWCSRFKKYCAGRVICAAWFSFPINDFSVSVLTFVEDNASFMSVVHFSLLVEIPSESECLCPTLGMSCARIVVPLLAFYLRRVDGLVSGVMMDVVVGIVYGWPIEPHYPMFFIDRYSDDYINESIHWCLCGCDVQW